MVIKLENYFYKIHGKGGGFMETHIQSSDNPAPRVCKLKLYPKENYHGNKELFRNSSAPC